MMVCPACERQERGCTLPLFMATDWLLLLLMHRRRLFGAGHVFAVVYYARTGTRGVLVMMHACVPSSK